MKGQWIDDWDGLYKGDQPPAWEDMEAHEAFCALVMNHCDPQSRVLELGCGLGHNAVHLARAGLSLTATDISPRAVEKCRQLAHNAAVDLHAAVLDVTNPPKALGTFDVVYEKGCWHSFFDPQSRADLARAVHGMLKPAGIWISSAGSADHHDDPNDPQRHTYPRLTLLQIATAVEGLFEIIEVRKGWYGQGKGRRFKTWECVFRKR